MLARPRHHRRRPFPPILGCDGNSVTEINMSENNDMGLNRNKQTNNRINGGSVICPSIVIISKNNVDEIKCNVPCQASGARRTASGITVVVVVLYKQ